MTQVKIAAHKLSEGMYVAKLDRPWTETPFMFQGFVIKSAQDVRQIQEYCQFVYVDGERGVRPKEEDITAATTGMLLPPAPLPPPSETYNVETEVEQELIVATQAHQSVSGTVGKFLAEVRSGRSPEFGGIREAITEMEDSIIRNPDAFMWLRRLKKKDTYTSAHCVDTSILLMAFGRQMGLPRSQIHDLGLTGLMADVGKMKLPDSLLRRAGPLHAAEYEVMKQHVRFSLDIMTESRDMTEHAIAAVGAHHERFDGGGYPNRLAGGKIPLLGRMTAIADTFDAVTSDRTYAQAIPPHSAIGLLYELRNTAFQDELIEQFIQTLGPYPVGTLVELNNGEVGIVIEQNRVRRLRPKIVLLLDRKKKPLSKTPTRDLMKNEKDDDGNDLNILKSLPPGAYDIDPEEFYL